MIGSLLYLSGVSHGSSGPKVISLARYVNGENEVALTSVMTIKSRSVSPHNVDIWPKMPEAKEDIFSAEPNLPCVAICRQSLSVLSPSRFERDDREEGGVKTYKSHDRFLTPPNFFQSIHLTFESYYRYIRFRE